jgi:hypothetical protein
MSKTPIKTPDFTQRVTPREQDAVTLLPSSDVRKTMSGGPDSAPESGEPLLHELSDAVRFHDYDRALALAHALLKKRPDDVIALACIEECLEALEALHIFSSASLQRVPSAAIGGPALHALKLDHRAGFILSLVDGISPVSLILDMCPMPRPEALRVIFGLTKDGVLVLR